MDEDIYVSVLLDDLLDLNTLRDFFLHLKTYGVEEWEGWNEALSEFLNEEEMDELPY